MSPSVSNPYKTAVVVPNWNGKQWLKTCLDSLSAQTQPAQIIVVENGSRDGSAEFIEKEYPEVVLIRHRTNQGFAGGVNAGIKRAMASGVEFVALFNNDAAADPKWLAVLGEVMQAHSQVGIVTSKILDVAGEHIDSTGDIYTSWGLPYPRGRGEADTGQYDIAGEVFGASGGASLYRVKMLEQIGLFDEDFFAYFEDVDISFRAQLAGWKVRYQPKAVVYHQINATSARIKGFATYHTLKNLPLLFWKNVPSGLKFKIWWRLLVAWWSIAFSALARGQFGPFFKACVFGSLLWPKKLLQRRRTQKNRKVSAAYIDSIIDHDLPPNARKLRKLRSAWWKLRGKK